MDEDDRHEQGDGPRSPLFELAAEDLDFVLRMVLASGSLKELAGQYGVSYPTIRARLDRLIERLRRILEGRPDDPMAKLLGDLVERGELGARTARAILDLHRAAITRRGGEDHD